MDEADASVQRYRSAVGLDLAGAVFADQADDFPGSTLSETSSTAIVSPKDLRMPARCNVILSKAKDLKFRCWFAS